MPVAPDALANWANAITVGRLLLSPLMFLVIPEDDKGSWIAFGLWFVLCVSDFIDGYLARRHGTTSSGAFLDPLADKVLVLGAMFTLVARDIFPLLPVAIIAAREFIISIYRTVASSKGVSVPASRMGKWKTFVQQLAVGFALWPWFADAEWFWTALLWAAVVLSVLSRRPLPVVRHAPDACAGAHPGRLMRCDVLAVGTELLLGQIVDTNSAWLGEQLAANGIDSLVQVKIGDNRARIADQLRAMLADADAVIVCGGLGPTHDDVTREAIAEVMGTTLERDEAVADVIRELFASRGRRMADNNLRQADVPVGRLDHPADAGHGAGLICPVRVGEAEKVVFAVPGVPHEMREMFERGLLPELRRRGDDGSMIVSRVLRTWGESESGLNERLDGVIAELDALGNPTLAFLASGWDGLKIRLTAKAESEAACEVLLDEWDGRVRDVVGELVFGVDDDSMESVVLDMLRTKSLTLGLAESVTGGLVAARLTEIPGASDVLRGSIVSYATEVKQQLLDVPEGPVVSEEAALAMARGARGCWAAT